MMTRSEAQQRAAVYGAHIQTAPNGDKLKHAAVLDTWTYRHKAKHAIWRDDIEDAVLDCGRLKP